MGRRIFLDVGANTGQSLAAVIDLKFDKIVCFEPASFNWPYLQRIASNRPHISIQKYGLWDKDTEAVIYDPTTKGAGMWVKDKREASKLAGKAIDEEICQFRKASDWFRKHITHDDVVFLKLNCEGAECDILDDLLDGGQFEKVSYAMVDFDAVKVANLRHRAAETRERLSAYPFPRVGYSKEVMIGETHADRIRNWLRLTGGIPDQNFG